MATTNFKGQPVKLIGEFIQVGKVAPDFELVKTDLSSFSLKDLNGKNVILNILKTNFGSKSGRGRKKEIFNAKGVSTAKKRK